MSTPDVIFYWIIGLLFVVAFSWYKVVSSRTAPRVEKFFSWVLAFSTLSVVVLSVAFNFMPH